MRKTLIVGATSAIAQETAKLLATEGNAIFLAGRSEQRLQAVAEDLKVRGAEKVSHMAVDLNDFDQHELLVDRAFEALQGLDTVLIAHGSLGDQKEAERSFSIAYQELRTNLLSAISLLTLLANRFEQQGHGCIAVISSVAGDRGRQSNYLYGTAKGALSIFLQGLRNRLYESGVAVITLKPGFVDTPMTAEFKKGLLWVGPEKIGKEIYNAIKKKKNVAYLPRFWRGVMLVIRLIPEWYFKRMKL